MASLRWRRDRALWVTGLVVVLIGLAGLRPAPGVVAVTFFDVGQGDAIHLRGGDGFDLVVDGGPSPRFVHQLAGRIPATDRTLELVVLTHPDFDHLRGLLSLFDRFTVRRVLAPDVAHGSETYARWQALLAARGVDVLAARAGQTFEFPGGRAAVLWPTTASLREDRPLNDRSVVLRVDLAGGCLLLTGDLTAAGEAGLLDGPIACDVLKVAHHGSASSSSRAFLEAVGPSIAVVQVGAANRYGHPAPSVLGRLEASGATVLRTDRHGAVTIRFGRSGFRTTTARPWN